MKCPVCNDTLVIDTRCGLEVMRCRPCDGYWVQKDSLGVILERYMSHLAEVADRKRAEKRVNPWEVEKVKLVCPECGRGMRKFNYAYNSNVIVDRCETCDGIWLDSGEIEKIGEFLKYYGMPRKFWRELNDIKERYRRHGSDGGEAIVSDYDDYNRHGSAGILLGVLLEGLLSGLFASND